MAAGTVLGAVEPFEEADDASVGRLPVTVRTAQIMTSTRSGSMTGSTSFARMRSSARWV